MANLRIISDNAADRVTLTGSTTSGLLVAANLLSDEKTSVWRATGTTATLTGSTTTTESAAGVHLPFCNLSPTATIRVRLYSDTAGTTQVLDTGTVLACPAPARDIKGFTAAQAASAYAYGGGAHARVWFAATNWRRFVIDIVDTNNLQGYIEAGRLVVGPYWSATYNSDYGAPLTVQDASKQYRTDSGSLRTDRSYRYRQLDISLNNLSATDRTALIQMLVRVGSSYPVLLSLYPEVADLSLDRDHTIFGNFPKIGGLSNPAYANYAYSLSIEEI